MKSLRFFFLSLIASLLVVPTAPADARLRGDWETSGVLAPPYEAPYRYEYVCQIEVTDRVERPTASGFEKIYAVANFKMRSKPVEISDFSQLKWSWIASNQDHEEREIAKPSDAPSLVGHQVEFYLVQNHVPGKMDSAVLNVTASLPIVDFQVPRTEFRSVERSVKSFSVDTRVEAYRASLSPVPAEKVEIKVFVICDKKR